LNLLFWKKSIIPGEDQGPRTVTPARVGVRLYDSTVTYLQLYETQPAVRAVVDYIALNTAQVPFAVYGRGQGRARDRRGPDDPLARLLGFPNPRSSGFEFIRDLTTDLLISGNAYALMVRMPGSDEVKALVRLPASRVAIVQESPSEPYAYRYQPAGLALPRDFAAEDVAHFRTFSPDNVMGISPLDALKGVLGEDEAAIQHREHFWKNAARQEGFLARPIGAGDLGEPARKRLKEDWDAMTQGPEGAGSTPILEEGMTFEPTAFNARESEYIAGRQLTLRMVCSVYGLPSQLLSADGAMRGLDQASRNLLTSTLAPTLSLLEETMNRSLVPAVHGPDSGTFVEAILEEKTRGSFRMQSEFLAKASGVPHMTLNEARRTLNLPDVEGGDSIFIPRSFSPLDAPEPAAEETAAPAAAAAAALEEAKALSVRAAAALEQAELQGQAADQLAAAARDRLDQANEKERSAEHSERQYLAYVAALGGDGPPPPVPPAPPKRQGRVRFGDFPAAVSVKGSEETRVKENGDLVIRKAGMSWRFRDR
jgi:HK97 family phage portal protein